MKKIIQLMLIFVIIGVLVGCQHNEYGALAERTYTVDTTPPVEGSLKTAVLDILPWSSGRAESTSGYFAAETETGYYIEFYAQLFYADKSDLSKWIVVCPNADCDHSAGEKECASRLAGEFLLQNDRIFYITRKSFYPELWAEVPGTTTPLVTSMALNGSDRQCEYIFDESSGPGGSQTFLTANYAVDSRASLNAEGYYDARLVVVDKDGEYTLCEETRDTSNAFCFRWRRGYNVFGDEVFLSEIMDSGATKAFSLRERELSSVDLVDLPLDGAYLSGQTIRIFRPGDGYYAVNLTTREEMRLADCQLENSRSLIVSPNCILESTILGGRSREIRSTADANAFRFFNGVQWFDVALPEELQNLDNDSYLEFVCLGSDRMLFILVKGTGYELQGYPYQLRLNDADPILESLGSLNLFIQLDEDEQ